ncbi:hypothetical protein O1Q96_24250 [Streptomyces sp. Qhu-G9]|uniref:hypothetical protein n=1 Tax=Streptomyces sp. Qhu-G9 TaxID=3452799 RepID=UPI0022AC0D3A|nr:hypothetical protein [Streptomyces aurantiacus]WAU82579.1 hypothetical protein O1Q96_24250 [Streptomyces aurantiacus]
MTQPAPQPEDRPAHAATETPCSLWRQLGHHALIGLASSTGTAAVAVLHWWLQHH